MSNYIPFGPEWKKEMLKFKKDELVDWVRNDRMEIELLKSQLQTARYLLDMAKNQLKKLEGIQ